MRSGARRGRVQTKPVVQADLPSTRRRRAARTHQPVDDNPLPTRSAERRKGIELVEGCGKVGGSGREENREGVGEKTTNDFDRWPPSGKSDTFFVTPAVVTDTN